MPDLDVIGVRDVELARTPDPVILQWAADNGRVVLTHDKKTMRDFADARVRAGLPMPGLIIVHQNIPIGPAIRGIIRHATGQGGDIDRQVVFVGAPRRTLS